LILITGLTPECGKLNTAIAQIYLDQEIGIEAEYAKINLLPDGQPEEGDEGENEQRRKEKFTFLQHAYTFLKKTVPQHMEEIQIGG